jgi:hypothetical protein
LTIKKCLKVGKFNAFLYVGGVKVAIYVREDEVVTEKGVKLLIIPHEQWRHELAVNVRSADRGACAEVLCTVRTANPFQHVLMPFFILPPCAGVGFLRPKNRCRVYDGVPVWVGLGILCTQSLFAL